LEVMQKALSVRPGRRKGQGHKISLFGLFPGLFSRGKRGYIGRRGRLYPRYT